MGVSIDERNSLIFKLWNDLDGDFEQLAAIEFPGCLSLKTVRNIVYSCGRSDGSPETCDDDNCSYVKIIYRMYRVKFLELTSVNDAIHWVWENQPKRRLSIPSLRRIVREMAASDKSKKNLCKNI